MRKLEWKDIEDMISDAWGTASRRPKTYYDWILQTDQPPKPVASRDIVPFTAHPGHLAAVTEGEFKDKTLKCARSTDTGTICNAEFTWSAQEQQLPAPRFLSALRFLSAPGCLAGLSEASSKHRLGWRIRPTRETTEGASSVSIAHALRSQERKGKVSGDH